MSAAADRPDALASDALAPDALARFALACPKVELHVHLEGSIRPETLLRLARRRRVALPADTVEGLREWFSFRDFEHFVEVYLTCSRCLRDPEDFQLVARDFLAEQARQNVLWSEVHFTIGTHLDNGANGDEVAHALAETLEEGRREHGVEARWIPDIVRNVGGRTADRTLEWAVEHRRRGVVALGLSGFESEPDEPFREHFREAAQEGLHRVAHAGEHGGPESIRSVLEVCGAERIGHGVRAVEDPALVEELAQKSIPLEVCPTSNLCLGVAPDLASHPLPELAAAGVELSINSDDPPFFETTLSDEYARVADAYQWGAAEIAGLALAALRHSFVPDERRRELEERMGRGIAAAAEEHLGEALEPAVPRGAGTRS